MGCWSYVPCQDKQLFLIASDFFEKVLNTLVSNYFKLRTTASLPRTFMLVFTVS